MISNFYEKLFFVRSNTNRALGVVPSHVVFKSY